MIEFLGIEAKETHQYGERVFAQYDGLGIANEGKFVVIIEAKTNIDNVSRNELPNVIRKKLQGLKIVREKHPKVFGKIHEATEILVIYAYAKGGMKQDLEKLKEYVSAVYPPLKKYLELEKEVKFYSSKEILLSSQFPSLKELLKKQQERKSPRIKRQLCIYVYT